MSLEDDLQAALEAAREELEDKSLDEIHRETAIVWTGRALAASEMDSQSMSDAREYAHEAIEHAALSGDYQLLAEIDQVLRDCNLLG